MKRARFKNILMGVALCLGTGMPVAAQSHYESRLYIGAHGGVNLSRVTFTPSVTQSFNIGGNAGINFRYIEEKHFGFIAEVNWEQRGWKDDFEGLPYNYSRTVNYIQIPFLAHIYFGTRARFFINAGPSVSFVIGESTKSNFDAASVASNPDFDNRMAYHYGLPVHQKVDYGISGGIGGEFGIDPRNSIYLDIRFYYGLADVLKSGRTEPIRGSNAMSISASIGYWFRMK